MQDLTRLQEEQSHVVDYERQKELVRQQLETLQQTGIGPDIPFADKSRIMGLLVNKIVINTQERWYQLEGAITECSKLPHPFSGTGRRFYMYVYPLTSEKSMG